jgi:hypothetical protein
MMSSLFAVLLPVVDWDVDLATLPDSTAPVQAVLAEIARLFLFQRCTSPTHTCVFQVSSALAAQSWSILSTPDFTFTRFNNMCIICQTPNDMQSTARAGAWSSVLDMCFFPERKILAGPCDSWRGTCGAYVCRNVFSACDQLIARSQAQLAWPKPMPDTGEGAVHVAAGFSRLATCAFIATGPKCAT